MKVPGLGHYFRNLRDLSTARRIANSPPDPFAPSSRPFKRMLQQHSEEHLLAHSGLCQAIDMAKNVFSELHGASKSVYN
jgi:hypothetical protein